MGGGEHKCSIPRQSGDLRLSDYIYLLVRGWFGRSLHAERKNMGDLCARRIGSIVKNKCRPTVFPSRPSQLVFGHATFLSTFRDVA